MARWGSIADIMMHDYLYFNPVRYHTALSLIRQVTKAMRKQHFETKSANKRLYIGVACANEETFKCLQDPYSGLSFNDIRESVDAIVNAAFVRMFGNIGRYATGNFVKNVVNLHERMSLNESTSDTLRDVNRGGNRARIEAVGQD
jgi:hypothetical protein